MATAHVPERRAVRRPTNVSLDQELVSEAKALGINVSRACETGLAASVRDERARRWVDENRPAMEYWNRWTEENGLPFDDLRRI